MLWLFAPCIDGDNHTIIGEDALHITKSLRMKQGEELVICTDDGYEHLCEITSLSGTSVEVKRINSKYSEQEPTVKVTLYQALTKGDKMDMIIQKAVELGVSEIVPVVSSRCISRPDGKSSGKKIDRWNKIAKQAAMQSRRAIVPCVKEIISFSQAAVECGEYDSTLIYYEDGGCGTSRLIDKSVHNIAIFVGSEGGFEPEEVAMIQANGGKAATLGKRILRAETAPLAALSVIMLLTGNLE